MNSMMHYNKSKNAFRIAGTIADRLMQVAIGGTSVVLICYFTIEVIKNLLR